MGIPKSPHRNRSFSELSSYKFFVQHQLPEDFGTTPLDFYTTDRIQDYAYSKALMRIQERITIRALELLEIPPPARALDLGMGCGFATSYLHLLHYQVSGIDIIRFFLRIYSISELNPLHADMRWLGYRPASFDFIISISAIQWILAQPLPTQRLHDLEAVATACATLLRPGGKVAFQFYPKSDERMHELGHAFDATKAFSGQFVIDNPENPKKRKIFLLLQKS